MKADYEQGKLYLFYENEAERHKLFKFVTTMLDAEKPAEIGLLQSTDDESNAWGVYLRVLIEDNLAYIGNITNAIKKAKEQADEA